MHISRHQFEEIVHAMMRDYVEEWRMKRQIKHLRETIHRLWDAYQLALAERGRSHLFVFLFSKDGNDLMSDKTLHTDESGFNYALKAVDKAGADEPVTDIRIDNSNPDVLIVTPNTDDPMKGQITLASPLPDGLVLPIDVTITWTAEGDPVPGVDTLRVNRIITVAHAEAAVLDVDLSPITPPAPAGQ